MENEIDKQGQPELAAAVENAQQRIEVFSSHWLSHKHIVSAFGVVVMALIFLGMLVPSIEIAAWALCGVLVVVFIGIMVWRDRQAKQLNFEMEAAQKALKDYMRTRRKKK